MLAFGNSLLHVVTGRSDDADRRSVEFAPTGVTLPESHEKCVECGQRACRQAEGKLDKESHRLAGLACLAMGAVYQSNGTDVACL